MTLHTMCSDVLLSDKAGKLETHSLPAHGQLVHFAAKQSFALTSLLFPLASCAQTENSGVHCVSMLAFCL